MPKSPAYWFHPQDYENERVKLMTYEQEGVYRRLLDHQWANDGIPASPSDIAALMPKVSRQRFLSRIWPRIEPLFPLDGERRVNLELQQAQNQRTAVARHRRHLLRRLIALWGNRCAYCGAEPPELQVKHIVPVSRGGLTAMNNLTVACAPCNQRKHTKTAAEFGYPDIHEIASRIQ